jgi:hypothetical protein
MENIGNFLRNSLLYVRTIEESTSKRDFLKMVDDILGHLDDNYLPKIPFTEIANIINSEGIHRASDHIVGKIVKQINYAFLWLNGNKKQKSEVLKNIKKRKKGAYQNFLRKGIECLKHDKIFSWKYLVEIDEARRSGNDFRSRTESSDPEMMLDAFKERFLEIIRKQKLKIAEYLDQLKSLEILNQIIKDLRSDLIISNEKVSSLSDNEKNFLDQIRRLTVENESLKKSVKIERGSEKSKTLKKQLN